MTFAVFKKRRDSNCSILFSSSVTREKKIPDRNSIFRCVKLLCFCYEKNHLAHNRSVRTPDNVETVGSSRRQASALGIFRQSLQGILHDDL